MDMFELTIVMLAGFLSAVIKNGVGVGAGIFLLPTLALVFPVKMALGLGAPLMLASDILGIRNYWREWFSLKEFIRLFVPSACGLLVGTWLLPIIPGSVFKSCVGVFGMLYAVMLLFPQWRPFVVIKNAFGGMMSHADQNTQAVFYGTLAGVATVLAHAGGLVWSMYLMSRNMDRRMFVGTVILLFLLTNLYKTGAYIYLDLITWHMFGKLLLAIPAVFIGAFIGNRLNKRINQNLFRKIVLATIFVVSVSLVF